MFLNKIGWKQTPTLKKIAQSTSKKQKLEKKKKRKTKISSLQTEQADSLHIIKSLSMSSTAQWMLTWLKLTSKMESTETTYSTKCKFFMIQTKIFTSCSQDMEELGKMEWINELHLQSLRRQSKSTQPSISKRLEMFLENLLRRRTKSMLFWRWTTKMWTLRTTSFHFHSYLNQQLLNPNCPINYDNLWLLSRIPPQFQKQWTIGRLTLRYWILQTLIKS